MTNSTPTPSKASPKQPPKPLAYFGLALITLMYLVPITWDLFAWAICGSAFLHSPKFRHYEATVTPGFGSFGLMFGFIGIDKGFELLKQQRTAAFFVAFFALMGASIPVAALLLALGKAFAVKGLIVATHPRFLGFSAFALFLIACKIRAVRQYFRLMRPDMARLLHSSTSRFAIPSAEHAP